MLYCVILCIVFTLIILPAQYKDPMVMIMSYPPKIIQRVEELPQYKGTIKQREKVHISRKIFGLLFFVIPRNSSITLIGDILKTACAIPSASRGLPSESSFARRAMTPQRFKGYVYR